jgi:hypothetical protein
MKRFLCVVAILAGLVAGSVYAGVVEDIAAMKALKTGGYGAADYGPAIAAKAQTILDTYAADLTAAQKLDIYNFVGWSYWETAGSKAPGVEWYGKVLTNTSTAAADYDTRRNAKWMQGVITGVTDRAAGVALMEDAWGMPKKDSTVADSLDWAITVWIGNYTDGAGAIAAVYESKLINNPQFTVRNYQYNQAVRTVISGKFYAAGKWNAAGATAYLAAHPFGVTDTWTDDYSLAAQIKQAGGDLAGAREGFLECFRTLKRGGNPDVAIAAFQAIDNETMFKDAAEQTAFYNLLLRVVPATEGNAKFLGLVKSQIEAMK